MRGEPIELACPFCDKGKIQCWYIPGATREKVSRSRTFSGKRNMIKSSDTWLIQSGCNICNKSIEEVERELRKKNMI